MQSFDLKIRPRAQHQSWWGRQMDALKQQRLETPFGVVILAFISLLFGVGMVQLGYKFGFVMVAGLLGLPFFTAAVANQKMGLYIVFALSFFVLGIKRFLGDAAPVGLAMDIMIAGTFMGMLAKQIHYRAPWKWANNAVSIMVFAWIGMIFLQLFNPVAASRMAWLYTVRATGGFMVMYYVTLYAIDDIKSFNTLMKIWLGCAIAVVLYGFKQEYIGFFQFETDWIMADSERYGLLYIMGRFRKFSFLSDPMIYGVFMALSSVVCLIIASGPYNRRFRVFLIVLSVVFGLGMIHSGTRAAYIAFPAGITFFSTITLKRNVLILAALVFSIGYVLAKIPTSNLNLIRYQTAFRPEQDESYRVREANKRFVKPFIHNLPFGAGLGSTGYWGKRFSEGSPLADFPPDSGFVRVAVEQGYVSLFVYLLLFYVAFREGVRNHFKLQNPQLRNYSMALLSGLLILTLANFPQEAIGQIPNNLVFFVMLAMTTKLYELDQNLRIDSVQAPNESKPFQHGSLGHSRSLVGSTSVSLVR